MFCAFLCSSRFRLWLETFSATTLLVFALWIVPISALCWLLEVEAMLSESLSTSSSSCTAAMYDWGWVKRESWAKAFYWLIPSALKSYPLESGTSSSWLVFEASSLDSAFLFWLLKIWLGEESWLLLMSSWPTFWAESSSVASLSSRIRCSRLYLSCSITCCYSLSLSELEFSMCIEWFEVWSTSFICSSFRVEWCDDWLSSTLLSLLDLASSAIELSICY
jgi:hypothetical protein